MASIQVDDDDLFTGFANAPVDEDGKRLDFRDVPSYDESEDADEASRQRKETLDTPSSITQFTTNDTATEGSPMASVAPSNGSKTETESDEDADAAEGQGANGS